MSMSFKFKPTLFRLESRDNPSSTDPFQVIVVEPTVPPSEEAPPPVAGENDPGVPLPANPPSEGEVEAPVLPPVEVIDETLPPIDPDDVPPPIGDEGADVPFDDSGLEPEGEELPPPPPIDGDGVDTPVIEDNDPAPGESDPDSVPPPIG